MIRLGISRLRPWAPILVAITAATALTGCRPEGQAPQGTPVRAATRIVSLVPAVTEMLFAIGAGDRVVGVSSHDTFPPEVAGLPRVGALLDPDVERIIRLRADLVVIHESQDDVRVQLSRVGIRTYSYALGGLGNVTATIRALGPLAGRENEAGAVATQIERRIETLRRQTTGKPRPRTLLVFGREPGALRGIDASGGVGFLHDILVAAGGDNVLAAEPRESLRLSTEAILAAAPEVIVELRYGKPITEEDLQRERDAWSALSAVPAVRTKRVHLLVGDQFVVPGPRIVEAAEALAAVIAPATPRATPSGSPPGAPRSTPPAHRRSPAAPAPIPAAR